MHGRKILTAQLSFSHDTINLKPFVLDERQPPNTFNILL